MRDLRQFGGGLVRTWWFWAFALLALPNCMLQTQGTACTDEDPGCKFDAGDEPQSSAIMCDIEAPVDEGTNLCANANEMDPVLGGLPLTAGGVSLFDGFSSPFALDYSDAAKAECAGGPKKFVLVAGSFPDGFTVCLNAQQKIPSKYANATEACIAKCKELVSSGNTPFPADGADVYCQTHAHVSTNFFDPVAGACTAGGTPDPAFFDKRRNPEDVKWIDFDPADITNINGEFNSIQRTAQSSGSYDKGPASDQIIASGDVWVEFSTLETTTGKVVSLRESCKDAALCPDTDHTLNTIGWGLMLSEDGYPHVVESKNGLDIGGPQGNPYKIGERYRVRAMDNHDGTARIEMDRFESCDPAPLNPVNCTYTQLWISSIPAIYPLRVDTSMRDENATLSNVTLMRIIPKP